MLSYTPDLTDYQFSKERVYEMSRAFDSSVFGGSVLQPVGSLNGSRTKANCLEFWISKMEIQAIRAGGYYVLKNVRKSPANNIYLNIYLLTEAIDDQTVMQKIKAINDSGKGKIID